MTKGPVPAKGTVAPDGSKSLGCPLCNSGWNSFDDLVTHVGLRHRKRLLTEPDPYGDLNDIKDELAARFRATPVKS